MRALKKSLPLLAGFLAGLSLFAIRSTGRADAPPGRYTVTFDVVYDQKTGLYWTRDISPSAVDHAGALAYCDGVSAGGAVDWRLPTIKELQTLVDEARTDADGGPDYPLVDQSAFGSTGRHIFWSSSEYADDPSHAWSLNLESDANASDGAKTTTVYARCVRP